MTDRPIIFSAPMVRALLDGHKTMTRRLAWRDGSTAVSPAVRAIKRGAGLATPWQRVKPGDRLWVREAFAGPVLAADGGSLVDRVFYLATDDPGLDHRGNPIKGRPSIHMPREISRLTLVVTAVRVERLQDISEEDARAEGMVFCDHGKGQWSRQAEGWHWDSANAEKGADHCLASARLAFGNLWNHLHGASDWHANPYVVAITFAVHPRNIDQMPA